MGVVRARWPGQRVNYAVVAALVYAGAAGAILSSANSPGKTVTTQQRLAILRRAQVWAPTDIRSMDLRAGPQGPDAFAPDATITCDHVPASMSGRSPKFTCAINADDHIKVKYGRENGEVYAEVAATRLLWAIGFAADRMYPVQVICRHCPKAYGGREVKDDTYLFDIASVERKLPGHEVTLRDRSGWTWPELDVIDEEAGGAPRAHRDALKLLAAMLQHTDSKSEQQRLQCAPDDPAGGGKEKHAASDGHDFPCDRPIALINDLGLTFGGVSQLNVNAASSANFVRWSRAPVWAAGPRCVAAISVSSTGTLDNPRIGEDGRAFLAGLLEQLSDRQLRDMFEVARFHLRRHAPDTDSPEPGRIDEWVAAFKSKRDAIAARHCDN